MGAESSSPASWTRLAGPAIVVLAALVAITPLLMGGASCGHDFDFHAISWLETLNSWRQGVFFPHWADAPNYGAGEPAFVFYPPLTRSVCALLGAILPWPSVPAAVTFLVLAGIGLATRALARQAMEDGPATLAGCVAIFSGYVLFTAYERSDFAELTGGIWLPVLLLLMLPRRTPEHLRGDAGLQQPAASGSLWRNAFDGSAAPLALVVAAAWLTNPPVGVMACYLLAALSLALLLLTKSWAPILRAAAGVALGVGLAAIYLIPAAWEQRWVEIQRAINDPMEKIQYNWLFARHADPRLAFHDSVLHQASLIAVVMITITLAGLWLSWRRGSLPGKACWWLPLAAIPVVVLFLQLPVSQFVWNLPKLQFLQFPWRWLVAVEAPMGIFFASAVWTNHPRRRRVVVLICVALFLAEIWVAKRYLYTPCEPEDSVPSLLSSYRTGVGFDGSDEYTPVGADNSLVALGLPDACLVTDPATPLGAPTEDSDTLFWHPAQGSCDATFSAKANPGKPRVEHWLFHAMTRHAGFLVLRLREYPAWRIQVNGQLVRSLPERSDGLIAVPVPQGTVVLAVDWTTTTDVLAGRWVSALSVLLLAALVLLEKKLSRAQL